MKSTFADSFYFMAVLSRNDQAHERAMATLDRLTGRLITTEFVLLEVGDAYSDPRDRSSFLELVDQLATDANVIVEPASSQLLHDGLELFRKRPDKGRSLADCTSFVVMQQHTVAAHRRSPFRAGRVRCVAEMTTA